MPLRIRPTCLALLLALMTLGTPAAELHVSPDGNDANPGTLARPWRTIQHAASAATPGSTVFIHDGTYQEMVSIEVSGNTVDGPIRFRGYQNDRPRIDGTAFTSLGDEDALLRIEGQHDLVVEQLEIANLSTTDGGILIAGVFVTGDAADIELRDLTIHDIHSIAPGGGDAHALGVYGRNGIVPIRGMRILDNEVRDCTLGSSEAVVLNGNVESFEIRGNVVHAVDNIGIDLIGLEGTADANDRVRDGVVADNIVFDLTVEGNPAYSPGDLSAAGIYVDGGHGILIERNIVHHADIGIELGAEQPIAQVPESSTFDNIVRDNLVYRNQRTGIAFGGYANNRGWAHDNVISNNTLFGNDTAGTGSGEIYIQKSKDNTIRENVLVAGNLLVFANYFNPANSFSNTTTHNLVFANGIDLPEFVWQNSFFVGLDAFRTATGQGSGSVTGDPLFLDPGSLIPDLHVSPGSPAVDAGDPVQLPAPGEADLDGRPRLAGAALDLGAYECQVPAGDLDLTVERDGTDLRLTASAYAGATGFDFVRGDLSLLSSASFAGSTTSCTASASAVLTLSSGSVPEATAWFLVRARSCGGTGTYGSGRDPGILASGADCP